jgi:hypothetical protein
MHILQDADQRMGNIWIAANIKKNSEARNVEQTYPLVLVLHSLDYDRAENAC